MVDNLSVGRRDAVDGKCEVVVADITDAAAMKKVFCDFRPETVIHTAAQVMIRRSFEDPIFDATVNIIGTISVLEACEVVGTVKQFIYTATGGARYGIPKTLPVPESAVVEPVAPYGVSKHSAEHYVSAYASMLGFDALILCFGNVYGPGDDPKTKRVIALIVDGLLRDDPFVIFGDGEQTRDFLYVEDIASVVSMVVGRRFPHTLYNLASGTKTSVNTIYSLIAKGLHSGREAKHGPMVPNEVRDIQLDITLARKELHFTPTPIEQGIRKTVEWFLKNYQK